MKRLIEQRHIVKQNFLRLLCFCLVCYFGYHSVMGERSIMRLMMLERAIGKVTADYEAGHAQRVVLEDRVVRLRPGSLDPDLLEERARYVLGFVGTDEQVILN